ncbi:DUF4113 domain-containing protein [Aeromonas veronii]|nr:DUF4113 domain-containing protein [Aeromonas veronii]WLD22454.1 DUF4113 domain-containing protein [Aeromonas veronii]
MKRGQLSPLYTTAIDELLVTK